MNDLRQHAAKYQRLLFVGFYASSGAAALVYEVAWTRLLTLQMGHTVAAASTVLAAFMGGLAAGAWITGRCSVPPTRRLQIYAALEAFVALVALALPILLRVLQPILSWAYADGDAPNKFAFVRLVLSLSVLGLPAAAMGATFPVAAAWFADITSRLKPNAVSRPAADVGALYAANSAGAAIGALSAGFWLIPTLGLRGTTWIGVILNALAALGALWLSRSDVGAAAIMKEPAIENSKAPKNKSSKEVRVEPLTASPRLIVACGAIALSGFLALVYEVVWTRLLELLIGPTTFAFTTMAVSFIGGIAIGSAFGAWLGRRSLQPGIWLAAMIVITCASASLAAWFAVSHSPLLVAHQIAAPNATFESVIVREVVGAVLLLLPMTLALGAAFSLALALASSGMTGVAGDTARVYASNTLGAIAGALAGGFLLLPRFGLHGTFIRMTWLGTIGGALCAAMLVPWVKTTTRDRVFAGITLLVFGALAILVNVPHWDQEILASGAYLYARSIPADELDTSLRAGRIEYYRDGAAATVSVRRLAGTLSLAIDGKVDASNGADMLTERLLGLLPALLHGNPRDVCIIGMGSGVTAGSILATETVNHVDVIETSPEVVQASNFFTKENGDALHAHGLRLIVGDGRSHLLLTRQRYDVIVSEPSNPWMSGVAALFTREFFEAARSRLKPDGVFCQWAHTYDISAADLKSIVHTFGSVFPQGTMWLVGDGDLLLIGTNGANIESRLSGIADRWRAGSVPAMLADVGITSPTAPFQLLSMLVGGSEELARYGDGARVQTDNRTSLEFTAPRAIYGLSTDANAATLLALSASGRRPQAVEAAFNAATAESWTARGEMALRANAFEMAYYSFQQAVALENRDVEALAGASEAAGGAHRLDEERVWLQSLAAASPSNVEVRVELSHVMAATGDADGAIAAAVEAARLDSRDPRPIEQLASIYADNSDVDRLEPIAKILVERFPTRKESLYYHATVLFLRGRAAEAAEEARRLTSLNPDYAKAQNLLGAAYAVTGQNEEARRAFETSLRLNPRDPSTYVNLGVLCLQTSDPAAASEYFAEAQTLDPTSEQARLGLVQAREAARTR